MKVPKLLNRIVLLALAVTLVVVAGSSVNRVVRENQKNAQIDQQRQRLENLIKNPSELLVAAKQVDVPPEAVRRMDYRQADYVDDMARRLTSVIDGRDTKSEIIAKENGDKEAKKRNDAVISLMSQQTFSDNVRSELGIADKPELKNSYYFVSKDIKVTNQTNDEELNREIAKQLNALCQQEESNCLISFNSDKPIVSEVLISLYPIKISENPLNYRVYAILRAYAPRG